MIKFVQKLSYGHPSKQAFSFYERSSGRSVRLVLKPQEKQRSREESFDYYQTCSAEEMFDVKEPTIFFRSKSNMCSMQRSHREDQKRFYSCHYFYSLEDFAIQLLAHNRRSNNLPMRPLHWLSPAAFVVQYH